jgi:membrane protease YdiL (CAAX protease family)
MFHLKELKMENEKMGSIIPVFSTAKILLLSLFPGVLITIVAFVLANPYFGPHFSFFTAMMLSAACVCVPLELGIIAYYARKNNKTFFEMIPYKEHTSKRKTVFCIVVSLIIGVLVMATLANYEHAIWKIVDWIPEWFRLENTNFKEMQYLKFNLVIAFIFNGFLAPLTEELYFRGFLLPRMNRYGKFAPLLNVALFSIYHFWQPREIFSRIIALLPMTFFVWKDKNIRIDILFHCIMNLAGLITTVIFI